MKSINLMNKKEKLTFIKFLRESEETFFTDYSKEIALLATDPEVNIRKDAIDLLWDDPNSENMHLLLNLAQNDPVPEARQKAIIGLGRYIYEGMEFSFNESFSELVLPEEEILEDSITKEEYFQVKRYLLDLYHDFEKPISERRYALESLGFAIEEDVLEIIREAYNSEEKLLKLSAVFAMGRNGLLCWKNILMTEIDSRDRAIQQEAISAVGAMGLGEAGTKLLDLTYSPNPDIAKTAIWALAQTGWQGAYERLDELSRISNREIRELAESALEEWQSLNSDDFDNIQYY